MYGERPFEIARYAGCLHEGGHAGGMLEIDEGHAAASTKFAGQMSR